MKIYAYKINKDLPKSLYEQFLYSIHPEKRIEIESIKNDKDQQQILLAHILLRSIICDELKVNNDEIHIKTNAYHKPYLRNHKNFHFNISHSNEWIVCATDDEPIGIDIEEIKPIDLNVAKHFFTREEYKYILESKPSKRLECFYSIWTLKESYIKAIGKGISIPLNTFNIKISKTNIQVDDVECHRYFKQYDIDKNYKFSVCAIKNKWRNKVILKKMKDLNEVLIL